MAKEVTITSRKMRALELNSEYFGVSRLQLMENAGRGVADEVSSRFAADKTQIAVFCGTGGNGGDGFVAARHLLSQGFGVEVILAGRSKSIVDEAALKNWQSLQPLKELITFHEVFDSTLIPDTDADVVVDALLGIGLKGSLRPPILQLVRKINQMEAFRVAVDVPTGMDSDSGKVLDEAVKADLTITFHKMKPGFPEARKYTGELVVKDIGLPAEIERFTGPGDVSLVAEPRPPEAHKGDFGRLLIIGGSKVFSGAPTLVALAALRAGVDLTYIAAPQKTATAISSMSPNLITAKLEGDHLNLHNTTLIKRHLETSTAVVIGPGLGLHKETEDAVHKIVEMIDKKRIPLLLDADGLKAFAKQKRRAKFPLVLTPHAGEYQILTGRQLPAILRKRAEDVQKTARSLNAVVLLKSNVDVISDGEQVKLNFTGNPGMTVGGTGDTLSGIIGAFLARGANPFEAAVAGAFINGAAGDFVQGEKGYHMVPTDIIEWIPHVMDNPMSHVKVRKRAPERS